MVLLDDWLYSDPLSFHDESYSYIIDIFRVYQEAALREVGPEFLRGSGKMRLP